MTATSDTAAPAVPGMRLPLALSIALRELRAGAGGLIVFVLLRVVPGDPVAMMISPGASAADISALHAHYGLDKPISVQLLIWLVAMGWLTCLGLGQLYKIIPFMTWLECYGPVLGKVAVPRVQDLVNEHRAVWWFGLYIVTVGVCALALFVHDLRVFTAGGILQILATLGLIAEFVRARRLSWAPADVRLHRDGS